MPVRLVPSSLTPAAPPVLDSLDAVLAFAGDLLPLLGRSGWCAVHLDAERRPTCFDGRLPRLSAHYGYRTEEDVVLAAEECGAPAVLVLDLRTKPREVSASDRTKLAALRRQLGLRGVELVDRVLLWPGGGASVAGLTAYVAGAGAPWLRSHVPALQDEPARAWRDDEYPPLRCIPAGDLDLGGA